MSFVRWPECWQPQLKFCAGCQSRWGALAVCVHFHHQIGRDNSMKRHSGWLAAGLLLFTVLACNLSKNSNNNSNNSNSNSNKNSNTATNRPANAEIFVDKISMAKDDNGKPGETTTTFAPGDRTIHCIADLNKAKAGTKVKFVW